MSFCTEEPVSTPKGVDETVTTHPAYAQIVACRVSGHASLYGSDFEHSHYMTVSIKRSQAHRNLSRDWHFGREELIEVAMSEAQWATFISTPNVGSGIPCTLGHFDGQPVPQLPPPKAVHDTFKEELKASMERMQQDLNAISQGLDGPLAKTKVAELRRKLEWISQRMTDSTGFVAQQFGEHVEVVVEKAKVEISAYAMNVIQRAGIESLAGSNALLTYDAGNQDSGQQLVDNLKGE
jgi:hypothetical protein